MDEPNIEYIIPHDAFIFGEDNRIKDVELTKWIELKNQKASLLFIADCCHSGGIVNFKENKKLEQQKLDFSKKLELSREYNANPNKIKLEQLYTITDTEALNKEEMNLKMLNNNIQEWNLQIQQLAQAIKLNTQKIKLEKVKVSQLNNFILFASASASATSKEITIKYANSSLITANFGLFTIAFLNAVEKNFLNSLSYEEFFIKKLRKEIIDNILVDNHPIQKPQIIYSKQDQSIPIDKQLKSKLLFHTSLTQKLKIIIGYQK